VGHEMTRETLKSLARFQSLREELKSAEFKQGLMELGLLQMPGKSEVAESEPLGTGSPTKSAPSETSNLSVETTVRRRSEISHQSESTARDHLDSIDAFIDEIVENDMATAPSSSGNRSEGSRDASLRSENSLSATAAAQQRCDRM